MKDGELWVVERLVNGKRWAREDQHEDERVLTRRWAEEFGDSPRAWRLVPYRRGPAPEGERPRCPRCGSNVRVECLDPLEGRWACLRPGEECGGVYFHSPTPPPVAHRPGDDLVPQDRLRRIELALRLLGQTQGTNLYPDIDAVLDGDDAPGDDEARTVGPSPRYVLDRVERIERALLNGVLSFDEPWEARRLRALALLTGDDARATGGK